MPSLNVMKERFDVEMIKIYDSATINTVRIVNGDDMSIPKQEETFCQYLQFANIAFMSKAMIITRE